MKNPEHNNSQQSSDERRKAKRTAEVSKTAKEFSGGILTNEVGDYDDDSLSSEVVQNPL